MRDIQLRRVELQFHKRASATDPTQVPASGATYEVHRQGATVTAVVGFTTTSRYVEVPVADPGDIVAGEPVQLASDPSKIFTVHSVAYHELMGWILRLFPQDDNWTLAVGDRLITTTSPFPTLYADSAARVPLPSNVVTLDSEGRGSFFCRNRMHDAVLSGAGATRLLLDRESGRHAWSRSWVNAADYPTLQAAIEACPTGGTVFIPAGDYFAPTGGFVVSRTLTLRGEAGTRLIAHAIAENEAVLRIVPDGRVLADVELCNLVLTNPDVTTTHTAGNHGIVCDVPTDGSKVTGLTLDRIRVYNMGDDGIKFTAQGGESDSFFVFVTCRRVETILCKGYGFYLQVATVVTLQDCFFNANDFSGFYAKQAEVALRSCAFESNCKVAIPHPEFGGQARVDTCKQARFDACRFEQFTQNHVQYPGDPFTQTPKRGLAIQNSPGASVTNCFFVNKVNNTHDADARGIYVSYGTTPGVVGAGVQASVFYGNVYENVATAMEIDGVNNPALDCVVFPHHATPGSGAMVLPFPEVVVENGLILLGGRSSPDNPYSVPLGVYGLITGVVKGESTPSALRVPQGIADSLEPGGIGRLVIDPSLTPPVLKLWTGSTWRSI